MVDERSSRCLGKDSSPIKPLQIFHLFIYLDHIYTFCNFLNAFHIPSMYWDAPTHDPDQSKAGAHFWTPFLQGVEHR
ncbi:hypothetical protein GmHk_18G052131 [Glycine max]|nr:hypothetical protein GmHk_18G052131 [Glycine max]